jgi:plasmid stabilization system protein ParE
MARVLKREAAKGDLIYQWVWYAENASVEVADRFLRAADDTLNLLSTQPESGASLFVLKPELQGMRRFPVTGGFERILLFYFPLRDGVDLVRVVPREPRFGDASGGRILCLNRPGKTRESYPITRRMDFGRSKPWVVSPFDWDTTCHRSPLRKQPVNSIGGLQSDYIRLIVRIVIHPQHALTGSR